MIKKVKFNNGALIVVDSETEEIDNAAYVLEQLIRRDPRTVIKFLHGFICHEGHYHFTIDLCQPTDEGFKDVHYEVKVEIDKLIKSREVH